MTTNELDLTADIIDVRDIIERVEELEELQETGEYTETPDCELRLLQTVLDELKGNGGDEQWRGDWYPVTLIRESHFTDYAEELVCDCYDLKLPSFVHIDWEATAREVLMDYAAITIDGITYFYR